RGRIRHRPRIQQYGRMVSIYSSRGAPAQGSAILPLVRGECGNRVHRLRLGTKSAARYIGRAGAPSAGGRGVRARRQRHLPAAQFNAELAQLWGRRTTEDRRRRTEEGRTSWHLFSVVCRLLSAWRCLLLYFVLLAGFLGAPLQLFLQLLLLLLEHLGIGRRSLVGFGEVVQGHYQAE